MAGSTTIKDVASIAEVSVSTASRAIRSHLDVRPETRERVLQAARDLGYYPSALARGLVSGKSMEIGLMVADITNAFYSKLARAFSDKANESDYSVMLCETRDDPARSHAYVQRALSHRVDGLIHAAVGLDESVVSVVRDAGVPVVLVNRRPRGTSHPIDFASPDYFCAAHQATEYLISRGSRRILHLAGPLYASNSRRLIAGYGRALTKAGIGVRNDLILSGSFDRDNGYERTKAFLATGQPIDAVFAVGDPAALGAIDAIMDHGLSVPEDVSVMGCDNLNFGSARMIQLSTVNLRIGEMAYVAWNLLLDAIHNPTSHVPKEVTIQPELIIRGTTA